MSDPIAKITARRVDTDAALNGAPPWIWLPAKGRPRS